MSIKKNPLVSFVLIAYQAEDFILEALEGAVSQDYNNLEIIVSDDASNDGTFKIIEQFAQEYKGPHRLIINRNEKNLGLCSHINLLINKCSAEYIVLAAGDDISFSNRVSSSMKIFAEYPYLIALSFGIVKSKSLMSYKEVNLSEVSSKNYSIDSILNNPEFHINGAARSLKKSAFIKFGNLLPSCPTEDSTSLLRFLMQGKVAVIDQPMVYYRVHGNNLFASENKFKMNYRLIHEQYLTDIEKAVEEGIIDHSLSNRLKHVLKKRLDIREAAKNFHLASNKLKYTLMHIIFNPSIRLKQKLRYLKKSI